MKKLNTRFNQIKILVAMAIMAAANFAFAHTGTIKGFIMDAEIKIGLLSTNITVYSNPAQATYTDELGMFSLSDLPSGEFTIRHRIQQHLEQRNEN